MQFNNLSAFYLYFLSLFIVIFYLLQGIRNEREISSLRLWRNLNKESHSFSFRLQFEPDILFFLQILILLLLVTSLLQPLLVKEGVKERRLVFLVDRSASMQAVDQTPNRFSVSLKKVDNYLDDLSSETEVALVTAGAEPEMIQEFTDNRGLLKNRLNELKPTAEELNLEETLEFTRSLFTETEDNRIIFFTDRVFQPGSKEELDGIELVSTGDPVDNICFTDFDIRPKTGQPGEYEIFLKIANYSKEQNNVRIEITAGRRKYFKDEFSLKPGEITDTNYTLKIREPQKISVDILNNDTLQLDNNITLWLGTELNKEYRILQLGQGNYFLERGLLVLPGTRFFSKQSLDQVKLDQFDLVLFNGLTPPKNYQGDAVFINVTPPGFQIQERIEDQVLSVTDWEKEHQLLRFVDMQDVKVKNTFFMKEDRELNRIVSTTEGPLFLTKTDLEYKWLALGFELNESNFPLQLGFPVFLSNLVEWFQPEYYKSPYNQIKAGDKYEFSPFRNKKIKEVIGPDGQNISFKPLDIKYIINNTRREGLYQINYDDNSEHKFTVNLASSKESNLLKVYKGEKKIKKARDKKEPIYLKLWPYFILAALLILLIEWSLYHNVKLRGDPNAD